MNQAVQLSATGAAALAMRGLRLALGSGEIRRVYFKLALALLVVTLALMFALYHALQALLAALWAWLPGWLSAVWTSLPASLHTVGGWVLWLVQLVVVALVAPIVALFLVNIVFPFLAEGVFFAGLRAVDPARAAALEQASGSGFVTSTAASVRRLFYFVGITALCFLLSWIPLLGLVLGPVAQLWFTARMLSWELLDVYFERRGLDYAGQRALLKAHRGAMFGFGMPWTLLLAVPIVGPLGFGLAQASAALLVTEVLEKPAN